MKKIVTVIALLVAFSLNASAYKTITIEADGDKAGPTTISPAGDVSIDCDYSLNQCVRMTVTTSDAVVAPEVGDPTEITVFDIITQEPIETYQGGYVSHDITTDGGGAQTHFNAVLSGLIQVL